MVWYGMVLHIQSRTPTLGVAQSRCNIVSCKTVQFETIKLAIWCEVKIVSFVGEKSEGSDNWLGVICWKKFLAMNGTSR